MLKEKREVSESNITFLSIIAGKLMKTVDENTPGAIKREWTVGGKSGVKWEKEYTSVVGKIKSVNFTEGEYGKNISIWVEDGDSLVCITTNVKTGFGEDILKKLPAVNLAEVVEIIPFEFQPADGDRVLKGVTFKQNDVKVKKFYRSEDKKPINGIPTPEGDTEGMDKEERSEYWNSYYSKVRRFMIKEIETKIIPKLEPAPTFKKKEDEKAEKQFNALPGQSQFPKDDLNPDDIPF